MASRRRTFSLLVAILTVIALVVYAFFPSPIKNVFRVKDPDPVTVLLVINGHQSTLAHYVEHLTWLPHVGKGSQPSGRDTNAWTSAYATGYWLSGQPETLPDMIRTLASVFKPLSVDRETAEGERDIILREYEMQSADNVDAQANMALNAFLYSGNAQAQSVIGTPEEIKALRFDEAQLFHELTHRPDRARLVVTGNVSRKALRAALQTAAFPELAGSAEDLAPPPFALAAAETRRVDMPDPHVSPRMIWRKVVELTEKVDFDLLDVQSRLAQNVLDTTLPGGLAGPLRFDRFVAKDFDIAIAPIDERHIELSFVAEPDALVSLAALQQAFEVALVNAARGVPRETYDRVRERFTSYWPDWSDRKAKGRWMANYVVDRVSGLREPKSETELRRLGAQLTHAGTDTLLAALAGPGRLGVAFLGKDRAQ